MTRRLIIAHLFLIILAFGLSACGETPAEPTATVVVLTGPDVPPTEVLPPTPTLITLPSPTAVATAVPPTAETEPTAVPEAAAEELAPTETLPAETAAPAEGEPEAVATETPEPALEPPRDLAINGMLASEFIMMSPAVRDNVRAIFAQGQALGRDPNTFSILGDSLIATPQSLAQWDQGNYTLGETTPTCSRRSINMADHSAVTGPACALVYIPGPYLIPCGPTKNFASRTKMCSTAKCA